MATPECEIRVLGLGRILECVEALNRVEDKLRRHVEAYAESKVDGVFEVLRKLREALSGVNSDIVQEKRSIAVSGLLEAVTNLGSELGEYVCVVETELAELRTTVLKQAKKISKLKKNDLEQARKISKLKKNDLEQARKISKLKKNDLEQAGKILEQAGKISDLEAAAQKADKAKQRQEGLSQFSEWTSVLFGSLLGAKKTVLRKEYANYKPKHWKQNYHNIIRGRIDRRNLKLSERTFDGLRLFEEARHGWAHGTTITIENFDIEYFRAMPVLEANEGLKRLEKKRIKIAMDRVYDYFMEKRKRRAAGEAAVEAAGQATKGGSKKRLSSGGAKTGQEVTRSKRSKSGGT